MPTTIEIELHEITEDFIGILEKGDEEKFKDLWHPKAIRFGLGNSYELMAMDKEEMIKFSLRGIKNVRDNLQNPEEVKFVIDEIVQIKCIEGVIGLVELKWHMILPESKGLHHTFIHYAKYNRKWAIVGVLDKGYEVTE
jgi:hypothetical protein